jgi:hypothetical protein
MFMIEVINPSDPRYDQEFDRLEDQAQLNPFEIRATLTGAFPDQTPVRAHEISSDDEGVLDLHPEDRRVSVAPVLEQAVEAVSVVTVQPEATESAEQHVEVPSAPVAPVRTMAPAPEQDIPHHGIDVEGEGQSMTGRALAQLVAGNIAKKAEERRAEEEAARDKRIDDFYKL